MRPLTATFLVWLLVVPVQFAQQTVQPPAIPTSGPVKFGTTAQLVIEDVMVKGKDGQPVEGLKASDFTVTEDGKSQKISVFEYQTLQQDSLPELPPPPKIQRATAAVPSLGAVQPLTTLQIAPEKPGDLKYRDRRLMVLFFDLTSMPIQDQIRAQGAAEKFLRTQMTKSDLVAMMT